MVNIEAYKFTFNVLAVVAEYYVVHSKAIYGTAKLASS